MKRRRGRRRKQVLNNLKETKGHRRLKKEALGSTIWGTGCERSNGLLVGQTTCRMHVLLNEFSAKRNAYYRPIYRYHKLLFFFLEFKEKNDVK